MENMENVLFFKGSDIENAHRIEGCKGCHGFAGDHWLSNCGNSQMRISVDRKIA
jgi:hypothetical protein